MGTSVGDSESEAESLNENRRLANQNSPRTENSGSSDESDAEEVGYDYARTCEELERDRVSSESSSESESDDDFMKDRQITEDYSRYRETIFDFSPRGHKEEKIVEEVHDDEQPSTSGLTIRDTRRGKSEIVSEEPTHHKENKILIEEIVEETVTNDTKFNEKAEENATDETSLDNAPESSNHTNVEENVNEDDIENRQPHAEDEICTDKVEDIAPNIEEISVDSRETEENSEEIKSKETTEEGIEITLENSSSTEARIEVIKDKHANDDEFQMMIECMGRASGISVKSTVNKKIQSNTGNAHSDDMGNQQETKENVEAVDTITNTENKMIDKDDESEDNISVDQMIENYTEEKTNRHLREVIDRINQRDMSKSIWTFDELIETVDRRINEENNAGVTEEGVVTDSESTENSSSATEDRPKENTKPVRLRKIQMIMRENVIKSSCGDDSDDELADNEEENSTSNLLKGTNTVLGQGDGVPEYVSTVGISNEEVEATVYVDEEINTLQEPVGIDKETEEGIEKVLQDSQAQIDRIARQSSEDDAEKITAIAQRMQPNETLMKMLKEDLMNDTRSIYSDESDTEDSADDEDKPYYRKLDKLESTQATEIPEIQQEEIWVEPEPVKSKEEILKEIPVELKETKDDEHDAAYREILTWELKISPRDFPVVNPESKEDKTKSEIVELIGKSQKENKPEFDITPPIDIVEENDVILYPRSVKKATICNQYKSMYTEAGRTIKEEDLKPPKVHKVLRMSPSYSVFESHDDKIVENQVVDEPAQPESALLVSNTISEVRAQMAEFMKTLDEFNERSRLAREAVIKDYNIAVEKEQEIVEKLMKAAEKNIDKQQQKWGVTKGRRPREITESVMKKHFEDMGVIVEEDDEYSDENKDNIDDQLEEKELEDKKVDTVTQVIDLSTDDLSDNISCEENLTYRLSNVENTSEEAAVHAETSKSNVDVSYSDEEVFYEDYLSPNDDKGEKVYLNRDVDIKYFELSEFLPEEEINQKDLERSSESCEEYFTTNEDSGEYDERIGSACDELEDFRMESSRKYDRFIDNLMEKANAENDGNDDDDEGIIEVKSLIEAASNVEKSQQEKRDVDKVEVEVDVTIDENVVDENMELPVIRRNVTCSLEMQLAKKSD